MRYVFLLLCLVLASPTWAAGTAVIANMTNGSISMLNVSDSGTATLSGPYLEGQLGSVGGGTIEVAVANCRTVLVSNFGNATVYFVSLPNFEVLGNATVGFYVEDIALDQSGAIAMVTDGGLSSSVAILDVPNHSLITTQNISPYDAQSVALTPDGQTAVFADYQGGQVVFGRFDPRNPSAGITDLDAISIGGWPINTAISPDGRTVLVPKVFNATTEGYIYAFQVASPGVLVPGNPPFVAGMPTGEQSVAYSLDGSKAYVLSNNGTDYNTISVLNVNGPGRVSLSAPHVATIPARNEGQYFGIDTLDVLADGRLVAGNPGSTNATNNLFVITPGSWDVTTLPYSYNATPTSVFALKNCPQFVPAMDGWGFAGMALTLAGLIFMAVRRRGGARSAN